MARSKKLSDIDDKITKYRAALTLSRISSDAKFEEWKLLKSIGINNVADLFKDK